MRTRWRRPQWPPAHGTFSRRPARLAALGSARDVCVQQLHDSSPAAFIKARRLGSGEGASTPALPATVPRGYVSSHCTTGVLAAGFLCAASRIHAASRPDDALPRLLACCRAPDDLCGASNSGERAKSEQFTIPAAKRAGSARPSPMPRATPGAACAQFATRPLFAK